MTLRDKMLAVIADTNASVAEREELVEMIAISLLTRKNLFVLGEPGQAKSYAINLFRRHITGARQFERLLSKPVSYTHLDVYKRQVPNMPDVFENVENVTGYLNTFGVTVADRIRNQFRCV